MSDTVGVQIGPGTVHQPGGRRAADHRRSADHRRARRVGDGNSRGAPPVRRRASERPVPRRGPRSPRCRPSGGSTGRSPRSRAIDTDVPEAQQRKIRANRWPHACRSTSTSPSDHTRATSPSSPAARTSRGSRSPRSTSARCSPTGSGRSVTAVLTSATLPSSLAASSRPARGDLRAERRRQPVRLRIERLALLRHAPPRPAIRRSSPAPCTTSSPR